MDILIIALGVGLITIVHIMALTGMDTIMDIMITTIIIVITLMYFMEIIILTENHLQETDMRLQLLKEEL